MNTARKAVDELKLTYYARSEHPTQLLEVGLDSQLRASESGAAADHFIAGKVYWTGFKQGDRRTKVWIADERDADYLGTDTRSLIQIAQVLDAQKMIVLDSTQEYASVGEGLLVQAKSFEMGMGSTVSVDGASPKRRTPAE